MLYEVITLHPHQETYRFFRLLQHSVPYLKNGFPHFLLLFVITSYSIHYTKLYDPTFDFYVEQFEIFVKSIQPGGKLFWFEEDVNLENISDSNKEIQSVPYSGCDYYIDTEGNVCVDFDGKTRNNFV